jgi:hypothetical protein
VYPANPNELSTWTGSGPVNEPLDLFLGMACLFLDAPKELFLLALPIHQVVFGEFGILFLELAFGLVCGSTHEIGL